MDIQLVRQDVSLESELVCPHCAAASLHAMPTDACQYLLDCPHCGIAIRPKAGDCCVFCSYGSAPCPPKQRETGGRSRA